MKQHLIHLWTALGLLTLLAATAAHAGDAAWSDPSRLAPPPAGAVGFPSRSPALDVRPGFAKPPAGYGEIPFWWWMGDPLTKDRITWELDQLKNNGISGLQLNYCHTDQGGISYGLTFPSDPPLFSEKWWGLFGWTMQEAKKRGMSLSLSDYTLGTAGQGFWIDEILKQHPALHGWQLERQVNKIPSGQPLALKLPLNVLSVVAWPLGRDGLVSGPGRDLTGQVSNQALNAPASTGDSLAVAVYQKPVPLSIDPLNPLTGPQIIEKFFQRFEDRNPGEGGKGLNFFFSDELNFGIGGNMWTARFAEEFKRRKGYDLLPELAAIFTDIGPRTPKIRLDYYDVLVALSEEAYFRPVFQWHYDRGMVYGCDHGGRGLALTEFGDYFRTQRWMTGPGCDQPRLAHDVIKNKVASSIAHLYQRPRVWSEEFHSTGWGANTDQMTRATNENYVAGVTLLTLHGLYYSTHGGWWEWAPPDFHFRMPYWPHFGEWLKSYERLSYLLSQGVHRCDVAILYPVSPLQAGTDRNSAANTAFGAGRFLFDAGVDFDFMDDDSLARAEIKDRELLVSGEHYRVLVLPAMSAIHQATLDQALKFYRAGGIVIALGDLPFASDRAGRDDRQLDAAVKEIFGVTAREAQEGKTAPAAPAAANGKGLAAKDPAEIIKTITDLFPKDFTITDPPAGSGPIKPHVLHRVVGPRDVYLVTQVPKGTGCFFRAHGKAELWDFWTGQARPLPVAVATGEGTIINMPLTETEAQLIVFSPGEPERERAVAVAPKATSATLALDGDWEFELKPTLDNRFGDFRLPVTSSTQIIGAEARRFKYHDSFGLVVNWAAPDFDDSKWPQSTYSYGPHFLKVGPLPAGADDTALVNILLMGAPQTLSTLSALPLAEGKLSSYDYSLREGIEGEPGHQGYHGLKENVSDDFIALGRKVASRTKKNDVDFVAEPGGTRYYLHAWVYTPRPLRARILVGDYKPGAFWLGGRRRANLTDPIDLPYGYSPLLLRYDTPGRGHFLLQDIKAPAEAKPYPLAMKWYTLPGVLDFVPEGPMGVHTGWYRFTAPPGLKEMRFTAFADDTPTSLPLALQSKGYQSADVSTRVWADGRALDVRAGTRQKDGAREYVVKLERPLEKPSVVAIRLNQQPGRHAGAAFPDPIALTCGAGRLAAGDWSKVGVLANYSGGAWYRKTVTLTPAQAAGRVVLNLGRVFSTAEVRVNGQRAGLLLAAPWKLDITKQVKPGGNRIEILVYNTLANYYATIPTNYHGNPASGLIGPVTLELDIPSAMR